MFADLVGGVAEDALGGRVAGFDAAVFVECHDAIGHAVHDRLDSRLAFLRGRASAQRLVEQACRLQGHRGVVGQRFEHQQLVGVECDVLAGRFFSPGDQGSSGVVAAHTEWNRGGRQA